MFLLKYPSLVGEPQIEAPPRTVPQFELITQKATSLDEFLSSPELLNQYFVALQEFYGAERFKHESFTTILKQLVRIKDHAPRLKERLWETTGLGDSFCVATGIRTYGRSINAGNWEAYLGEWNQNIATLSASFTRLPLDSRNARLDQLLQNLESQVESIQTITVVDKHAEKFKANFFKVLRNNDDLKTAAAYVLLMQLRSSTLSESLNSGDPDIILNTLEMLKRDQREWFNFLNINVYSLISYVKALIPDLHVLLKDETLFPRENYQTKNGKIVALGRSDVQIFRFEPIPRRIHGIWKGGTVMDCVGGSPGFLDDTTPERWAVSALAKTQVYHIERFLRSSGQFIQRDYAGFVQVVPQVHRKTGMIVGSVEFMSDVFFRKAVTKSADGKVKLVNIFDLWLKESTLRLNSNWMGFAIGESNALNYLGVLNRIRRLPQYLFGKREAASSFDHLDSLGHEIPKLTPRHGSARKYGGNMIFDAKVPDAAALTILNPNAIPDSEVEGGLQAKMLELMHSPNHILRWRAALATLAEDAENCEALGIVLTNLESCIRAPVVKWWDSAGDIIKRKRAELLDNHPYKLSQGELWVETITEIGRWFVRRKDLVPSLSETKGEPPRITKTFTLEQFAVRAVYLLKRAIGYGRIQEVQWSAVKTLGILRWRDPEIILLISQCAKPSFGYRLKRARVMAWPLRNEALYALGEIGWDHPDAIQAIFQVLKFDYQDLAKSNLLALEALEKLRSSDLRAVSALKRSLKSQHKTLRDKASSVLRELGYLSADTIELELAKATLTLNSSLPHEKISAISVLMKSKERSTLQFIRLFENQLPKETNPNVRSKLIFCLIELEVPNMWTICEVARRTPDQGAAFITKTLKAGTNHAKISKALKYATRIDSSPVVRLYVAKFQQQLRRHDGAVRSWLVGQVRLFITDYRIIGVVILLAFGIYNLQLWYTNIEKLRKLAYFEKKSQSFILNLQEIQQVRKRYRLLNNTNEENFFLSVASLVRTEYERIGIIQELVLTPKEIAILNRILSIAETLDNDAKSYFDQKDGKIGGRTVDTFRDEVEDRVQKQMDLIWDLKWENYDNLMRELKSREGVEFHYYQVVDAFGNMLLFILSILIFELTRRDSLRRVKEELLLRDNEERFEVLLSSIKDYATFTMSADGTVTSWHQTAEAIFGYTPDEVIGRHFSIFYTKKDIKRGQPIHDLKTAKTEGKHAQDKVQVNKHGKPFSVYQLIVPLKDDRDGVRGFVFVIKLIGKSASNVPLPDSNSLAA